MKVSRVLKMAALAGIAGIASQFASAQEAVSWWDVDFEQYALGPAAFTNEPSGTYNGTWTANEEGLSQVTNDTSVSTGNYLELDTQGTDLTWTPLNASAEGLVTYLDSDIYFVGSDTAPSNFGESEVQTAVYLKRLVDPSDASVTTGTVLCAWASVAGDNDWVELKDPAGVKSVADGAWAHLRIEIDYSLANPRVQFFVDEVEFKAYYGGVAQNYIEVANVGVFGSAGKRKLSSVSFRGTGKVDNFAASTESAAEPFDVNYTFEVQVKHGEEFVSGTVTDYVHTDSGTSNTSQQFTLYFEDASGFAGLSIAYGGETFTYTYSDGAFTPADGKVTYDTDLYFNSGAIFTDPETASAVVTLYYGGMPGGTGGGDPVAPVIKPGDGGEGAVGFSEKEGVQYFTVRVAAPTDGSTYSAVASETLGGVFAEVDGTLSEQDGSDIIFMVPCADKNAMFIKIKATK